MADQLADQGLGLKDNELDLSDLIKTLKDEPIKTVKLLTQICERAMMSRALAWERYSRKYRRGLRYVSQEGNKSPLYSTNYIFNVVETIKCNLTNQLPALTMQPVEEGDDLAADVFTQILRVAMTRANIKTTTENVVQHGAITGTGWFKVWFNEESARGKGDLALDAIAPEDVLILPTCLDYHLSGLFIHRVRDVSESQLRAEYGVKKIQGAPETTMVPNERGSYDFQRRMENIKTFNVYEAWIRDYETNEWWICTIAGSTLLRKPEKSPYNHGRAPFVPWYDVMDVRADQAYVIGVGEIEPIEMLQDQADSLDMRIYKNIKQVTGRQRVLNPASGINREDVDDTPSRVYLCTGKPSDAMMWDNPPALGQDVFTYRKDVESRIQTVSGIFDVTQGRKPTGVQAARAVSALQAAAAKRIEQKTKMLMMSIQDVGGIAASIILQYYSDERIIRMAGRDNIKIVGKYPPELKGIGKGKDEPEMSEEEYTQLMDQRGMWKQQMGINLVLEDINFDYDIIASTDSALPEDRGDRVQLAADLFRLGAIDRQGLLDAMDYPDRQKILNRLAGNVTGTTPPEADPNNQAGMQANIQAKAQAQAQAQQGNQAQAHQQQIQQMQMQAQLEQQQALQAHQQQMAQQSHQGHMQAGQQQAQQLHEAELAAMQAQSEQNRAAIGAMRPMKDVPV